MKKWMKGWIEKNAPTFFHIIKQIKKFNRMGYDVTRLYLNRKDLNDLFTANTMMRDNGLEIRTTWDERKNLFFDEIPIETGDRIGFTIKKRPPEPCPRGGEI